MALRPAASDDEDEEDYDSEDGSVFSDSSDEVDGGRLAPRAAPSGGCSLL